MSNSVKTYKEAEVVLLADLLGDLKGFYEGCTSGAVRREHGFIFGREELPVLITVLEDLVGGEEDA